MWAVTAVPIGRASGWNSTASMRSSWWMRARPFSAIARGGTGCTARGAARGRQQHRAQTLGPELADAEVASARGRGRALRDSHDGA